MVDGATWIAIALSIVSLLSVLGGWVAFVTKLKQELKAHIDMDDEKFDSLEEKLKEINDERKAQHRQNMEKLDRILEAVSQKERGH
jgi:uncharacterized membrane protein (DUF106 family)